MVQKHKEEEKEEATQNNAMDNEASQEGVVHNDPIMDMEIYEEVIEGAYAAGSNNYVEPAVRNRVDERIDDHMRQRLENSLIHGDLGRLKNIENNLRDFIAKKASDSFLEADINVFKDTLTDPEFVEFIAFMRLFNNLQGYKTRLEQVYQNPVARALAVILGIPINALPAEMLALMLYVVSTTACSRYNDTDSIGESNPISLRQTSIRQSSSQGYSSQEACAITTCLAVYGFAFSVFALINCIDIVSRNGRGRNLPSFFPHEYRNNPITIFLTIAFLMIPIINEGKTNLLTNWITSKLPSELYPQDKASFNTLYRQISIYTKLPFSAAEEDISFEQLLTKVNELIPFYTNIIDHPESQHYRLYQKIQGLQRKRETLEKDIARLNESLKENNPTILNNYRNLFNFNNSFANTWRQILNPDRKTEVLEEDVMKHIEDTRKQYTEIEELANDITRDQEEYQQQLNALRTERDEIKQELAKLKEEALRIQPIESDEREPLILQETNYGSASSSSSSSSGYLQASAVSINMHYNDQPIAVRAHRSGGSPIYNSSPEEYIVEIDEENISSRHSLNL